MPECTCGCGQEGHPCYQGRNEYCWLRANAGKNNAVFRSPRAEVSPLLPNSLTWREEVPPIRRLKKPPAPAIAALHTKPLIFLGIDPGANGGMACIAPGDISLTSMPVTEKEIWQWIRWYDRSTRDVFAIIEKVGGYVGNNSEAGKGGGSSNGSAMFKFGMNCGLLRMALTAARIPYDEVHPATWQKKLGISPRTKTESKSQWKNRIKQKCQQLYPCEKLTLNTADALLIARYGQMIYSKGV